MPLKLTNYNDPAVLNRWADGIEFRLNNLIIPIPPKTNLPQFRTNNVINFKQNLQNLVGGTGISITTDVLGDTVINNTSTPTGDGLIHGDPISVIDPAFDSWRDDFRFGNSSISVGGGSSIGEMKWDATGGSGATTTVQQGPPANPGCFSIASGTVNPNYSAIFTPIASQVAGTGTSGAQQVSRPLLDYPNWKLEFVFGTPIARTGQTTSPFPFTKTQFYCGLATANNASVFNVNNGTNARPPYFIGLRYDTDTTAPAISDTTFKFELVSNLNVGSVRNNTQGTVVDTLLAPVEGVFYRLEILYFASNKLTLTLSGNGSTFSHTFTSIPTTSSVGNVNITFIRGAGIGEFNQSAVGGTGSNVTFAIGSIVTIANAPQTFYNGTFTLSATSSFNGSSYAFPLAGANDVSSATASTTITGFPGLITYYAFGNDTQAAPVNKIMFLDYIAFVKNPGVGGGTAIPDPTKSRYF